MVCSSIVCVDHKPKKEGYLFFGDRGKYHRVDKIYFSKFKEIAEASEGNTWFMNEISYDRDVKGWERIPEHAKRMFVLNISYQTLMDNAVPNIFYPLAELADDSWLSYLWERIGTEESIHKLSYSSGETQVFGDKASEMLDIVYEDPNIAKRMELEIRDSDEFLTRYRLELVKQPILNVLYNANLTKEQKDKIIKELRLDKEIELDEEFKKSLLKVMIRVFLLEGVKFPFSFFVTWTINKAYDNAIQGFSHLLKLIAWDEMTVHTTTGANVLKILSKDKKQGFVELMKSDWWKDIVYQMVRETVDGEIEWAKYLLRDGNIPGLNIKIASHFIRYWGDKRLKEMGFEPIYNEQKSTIIDWFNNYRHLNKSHNSPQESDTLNYQKGKLKNDLDKIKDVLSEKIKKVKGNVKIL